MAMLPFGAYVGSEIEKCMERRDNGYWKCDQWADDWLFKCPGWQPGKSVCRAFVWIAKWLSKAYYWSAHKVGVVFKFPKVFLCVLYVSLMPLPRLCGKILGFDVLAPVNPISPFGPALAYGNFINDEGENTDRPLIVCWTEAANPLVWSSGLRLKYEQLRHYSTSFHNMLPQFTTKAVGGEVSHRGPALTFFNNNFFLAWTGKDSKHKIHVMQSYDGGDEWTNEVILNISSLSGPALEVFKNRIYLAWRNKPREGSYLNIISSADGERWENETRVMARAISGPALAVSGSLLFIAWNNQDDYKINIRSSEDGISFENQITLDETTDAQPALSAYGHHLYIAYKERGRNGLIKFMRSANGTDWEKVSAKLLPDWPLNKGLPALASCKEGLIIGWAGPKIHIAGRK